MDKRIGNRKRNAVIFIVLIVFALLMDSILHYRVRMNRSLETKEISDGSYTITWENKKYVGTYDGEYSNSKPNGEGTFTSDTGELTYEGEWKKGKFNGEGSITYEDGTWEAGKYKNGKRDGLFQIHATKDSYVEYHYNKGVPYGKVRIYDKGVQKDTDYYVNAVLLSELKEEAQPLSAKSMGNIMNDELYVYVEGEVVFIGEDDKNCYFRIQSKDAGMVTGSYRNLTGKKEKQAVMPAMKKGDQVRIYGYCIGFQKNNLVRDTDGYRYEYISIHPFYGENLSNPLENLESGSYALHNSYPYADYGEDVEEDFVVMNAAHKGKNYYVQVMAKGADSDEERYMLVYKGDAGEVFFVGEELHVAGYYDGQYKRLDNKEWDDYNAQSSSSEDIYTYSYDMYPVISVTELKR